MKPRRGRPRGWRKPDAYRRSLMIRLHEAEYAWLRRVGHTQRLSMSEIVRRLIARAKTRAGRRRATMTLHDRDPLDRR